MHMMPTCTCTHTHAHLQWFSTNQRASADYPTPSPLPGFACGAPVGRVRGDDELASSSRGSRHHTWLARRQRLQPTWWAAIGDGSLPQQAHTQAQAQAQASWTRGSAASPIRGGMRWLTDPGVQVLRRLCHERLSWLSGLSRADAASGRRLTLGQPDVNRRVVPDARVFAVAGVVDQQLSRRGRRCCQPATALLHQCRREDDGGP